MNLVYQLVCDDRTNEWFCLECSRINLLIMKIKSIDLVRCNPGVLFTNSKTLRMEQISNSMKIYE